MFRINQSCAICSEFEARLCKFMVIPLATLQRGVSIREEPSGGKERIGGQAEKGNRARQREFEGKTEQGKSKRRDREKDRK